MTSLCYSIVKQFHVFERSTRNSISTKDLAILCYSGSTTHHTV